MELQGYEEYVETPTIVEEPCDPLADAQVLRKAMKGFGSDTKAIINVLTRRTGEQRMEIVKAFKQAFGKDLLADLKSETSGKLEDVLVALMTPRFDYLAKKLHDAMSGLGTDEGVLIDILCTASNDELREIQASYSRLYGSNLEDDIIGETSGSFKRLLVSLCVAQRSEDDNLNETQVREDAQALHDAGLGKWGTDESTFNMILAARSYNHLRLVFQAYEEKSGKDIVDTLKSEFSGDTLTAMKAIVECIKNRHAYFAKRLHNAMKGLGTNDDLLIFTIVTHAEIDLGNIKEEYEVIYGKPLAKAVKSETSGDYEIALISLLG
jgi:annexin A7/11